MSYKFNPFTANLDLIDADTTVNGGVWITDIEPTTTGNVGDKVTSSDGEVLDSCSTDTTDIDVTVRAIPGDTNYVPVVTVNGSPVTMTLQADRSESTGTISIVVSAPETVTATHEDGATWSTSVTADAAPVISSAIFSGGYPGSQTEVKSGDSFSLSVQADIDFVTIETENSGAGSGETFNFSATTSTTKVTTIPDRGTSVQTLAARVRVKKASGTYSAWVYTSDYGSTDGIHTLELNNIYPTVSIIGVTYPGTQEAIKSPESATVTNGASDLDTILYSSPNSELTITNPTTGESPKTVTYLSGTYNITTDNFRMVANRVANDSTTTRNEVVFIAETLVTLAVTEPATRLRSGGNFGTSAQNHVITITASQNLQSAPTLVAPVGTWQGGGFSGSGTTWTRSLQIDDDMVKGTQNWGAISGTSLSEQVANTITGDSDYILGGFVTRTLTIAAWANRETDIGTQVADTGKLTCENLSKGGAAPNGGTIFTFVGNTTNAVDKFTITEPSTVYNSVGSLWYNNDQANAVSNTGGTASVILEEEV